MLSASILILTAACISSPLEPDSPPQSAPEGQEEPGVPTNPDLLHVSPTTIELATGEEQELSVWLDDESIDLSSAAFTTTSSDPDIADLVVDAGGKITLAAKAPGTASVEITAILEGSAPRTFEQETPVEVTVQDDEGEGEEGGGEEGGEEETDPPPSNADASLMSRLLGVPELETMWPSLAYTPQYDATFTEWGDTHWDRSAGTWEHTYYDRPVAWYAAWWRTGDDQYLERGHQDVIAYRDEYVLPNDGAVPPRWANPEGLAIHYALTGDEKSAEALAMMADRLAGTWMDNMLTTNYQDGRIQGRAVLASLMAHLVEAPARRDWLAEASRGVDNLIEWFEASGGDGSWDMNLYCGGQANFQVAHALLDVLIRYYDQVDADPRIPEVVRKSLDYMWNWWDGSAEGFSYVTVNCDGVGSTSASPDLDLLIVWPYGWYYDHSGDETYRTRGDLVFEGGMEHTFWSGMKQFNQSFRGSWRYVYHTR